MAYTDLNGKYRRLRGELEAAYAAPSWDPQRIDQIADALTEVEIAMALAAPQCHPEQTLEAREAAAF